VRIQTLESTGSLRLIDLSGKLVSEGTITENQGQMSLGDLPEGIYFLQLISKNGTGTKTVIRH
jgi:hypothetical protein